MNFHWESLVNFVVQSYGDKQRDILKQYILQSLDEYSVQEIQDHLFHLNEIKSEVLKSSLQKTFNLTWIHSFLSTYLTNDRKNKFITFRRLFRALLIQVTKLYMRSEFVNGEWCYELNLRTKYRQNISHCDFFTNNDDLSVEPGMFLYNGVFPRKQILFEVCEIGESIHFQINLHQILQTHCLLSKENDVCMISDSYFNDQIKVLDEFIFITNQILIPNLTMICFEYLSHFWILTLF